jgi:hypothetical protein
LGSLRKSLSQQFSHLERVSHGPDNPPLQSTGLTTRLFFNLTTRFFKPQLLSQPVTGSGEDNNKFRYGTGDGNNNIQVRNRMMLNNLGKVQYWLR